MNKNPIRPNSEGVISADRQVVDQEAADELLFNPLLTILSNQHVTANLFGAMNQNC